jgi:hypothetical protein
MALAPRILVTAFSCLIALVALAGQPPPREAVVAELQEVALGDDTAWELLESLTTEVGPRMGGTPGDALAVQWAKDKLKKLGFDRVWTEAVSFPYWERVSESARVVAPRAQALAITALGGSPGTEGLLRGKVVRFADLAGLEAADPLEVQGKIAFITKRMERHADGAGYGGTVSGRTRGPFVAAEKGALALIIRSVGTDNDRLPHTGTISSSQTGEPVPAAAVSNPDADIIEALLDRGRAVEVELDLDCGYRGTAVSHNVIGEFDGREPTGEFVVVGGHLDSWDLGTGAVDDGTGVAITTAAAKLVADLPQRPRRGIRVVLFANEEQGIYGGKAYARAHQHELAAHVLGAESDLGSGRIYRFRSRVAPGAESAMLELEQLLEPLDIPWAQDRPAGGGADLGQMRMLGMPVVDLNHDASRYFDLHHTANDTLDKVDPADLRFNVAAYVTMIYWAAEAETVFGPVAPSE